ncbi:MAG: hypothetical protein WBE38_22025 [Terracidiphilus sp.]|jgi:hypothetical protein
MEKQNDSLRDRLLAHLPQPENLAAYREETASLLAKHEKALFWERWLARTFIFLGVGVFWLAISSWGRHLNTDQRAGLYMGAALMYFGGAINELGYRISHSKVYLLKELKQVQLQILELQASLKADGQRQP